MQTFTLSGNQWFDQSREPVLLQGERGLSYYNKAAAELFREAGTSLAEGGELPPALAALAGAGDMAGEAEVAGNRWLVTTQTVEAGRLILLRPVGERAVFPNERLSQLTQRLRGPMANLLSSVELLTRDLPEEEPRAQRYLAVMNQNYCRLLRLVNHLDHARFLSGDEPEDFNPVVLDIAGLCREVGRQVSSVGDPEGHHFSWSDNAGSLLVKGDGGLLAQMLYQLIANAWRSGGDVTLQIDRRGDRAVIAVSDNGRGMSRDALLDAFDPAAGRDGLAAAMDGLGLGIPICQHIAALHGGTLLLESRESKGVSATVSLPLCKMGPGADVREPQLDLSGGFPPVLVELADVLPAERFRKGDLE